ncbi:type II toxin-antitoxin system RelE/ParE family toxin [Yokenella regensburgei]|uniref:type II toxin-antitoxin system RelE/ParE family toxin n=1 Tax=Yokenella regensburgei TaxID=158877 RepID=UPI00143312B4|nr:type II toxin-antitoxin system RelE/ParE family toxin [Yokenella regensburgei]QIU90891.1 type II toxin-antitoxin system RelE/ParE family toxin [Yokenella regensburgei]
MAFTVILTGAARKELGKLPLGLQAALIDAMEDLEAAGPLLRAPHVKDMGKGLKELRVSALEGIARGFFFFHVQQHIYVVHIMQKKSQKTPKLSLELALDRMNTVKRMLK